MNTIATKENALNGNPRLPKTNINTVFFPDTPAMIMGKIAHAVLKENFSLSLPINKRGPENVREKVRLCWKKLPYNLRKKIFGDAEDEKRYGELVVKVLQNYLANSNLSVQPLLLDEQLIVPFENHFLLGGSIVLLPAINFHMRL